MENLDKLIAFDEAFPKRNKKKDLKKNLMLLLVSILIMMLVLEIGLRIFYPQRLYNECYEIQYEGGSGPSTTFDPVLGWRLRSNYSACSYQPDTNKIIYATHNSKGIRLPYEFDYEKGDKKRIVLLGDSMVYGHGVDDSQTLAVNFQRLVGDNYEVIPISSPAWGNHQEFFAFKDEALKYKPDIVILFFYQNDFENNLYLNPIYSQFPKFKLASIDENEIVNIEKMSLNLVNYPPSSLEPPETFIGNSLSKMKPFSAFFMRFSHLYSLFYHQKSKITFDLLLGLKKNFSSETSSESWSVKKEYDYNMNYALLLTLKIFEEFKKVADENEVDFVIVNIPSKQNVDLDYQKKWVNQFSDVDLNSFQFNKVEVFFEDFSNSRNSNYFTLYNLARENSDNFYFKTDSHLSPKGVEMTAEYVYNELKKQKII